MQATHNRRSELAVLTVAVLSLLSLAGPSRARGAEVPPPAVPATPTTKPAPFVINGLDEKSGTVRLLVNKSVTLETSRPYKRLSAGQSDIAEVNLIAPTRILITGKKAGATQIIIFDQNDVSQTIDILVQANLLALRQLYDRLMPGSKIDVIDNEGTIALTGSVPNLATAEQAAALASGYGSKVLNLLEVAGGRQVMLQVRFAEVSKTATNALGVNLGFVAGSGGGGSNIGQVNPTAFVPGRGSILGNSSFKPNGLILTADQPVGPAVTQYGYNQFGNVFVEAYITALRENNLLRVLAEPNLVTTSGQEADFLAGGEFPVPIVQGGTNSNTSISVEFKPFGVKLHFTPVVLGDGKIRLKMEPEVSDVDFTFAVETAGFRIPGTRTRRLSTTVELSEGQSFAVGGLLDNRVAANKSVTPLLGDMPIIGPLFRSVRYQRQETELVVLVTPRIVSGMTPGEVPKLPGEHWRHPTEGDLFFKQDTGGPVEEPIAEQTPARRFIGRYGFVPAAEAPAAAPPAPAQ